MRFQEHHLLAALVYHRHGGDMAATRAAWSRMLQNHGWDDDAVARSEFSAMVERGTADLRRLGFRY